MIKIRYVYLCFLISSFFIYGCCRSAAALRGSPVITGDIIKLVKYPVFIEFLNQGYYSIGMPHIVVDSLPPGKMVRHKVNVAGIGYKVRLAEAEGWGRQYSDPSGDIFLDEYEVPEGKLIIWYRNIDFYKMKIGEKDILEVFSANKMLKDTVYDLIRYNALRVHGLHGDFAASDTLFGMIRYYNSRTDSVSYWYNLKIIPARGKYNDPRASFFTIELRTSNYNYYPIQNMELNGTRIETYNWRKNYEDKR